MPTRILVIQTAFIGDVILATGLIENLKQKFQDAEIDMLVRKGNDSLLFNNPHLHEVLIWDKKTGKYKNLLRLLKKIRTRSYDKVINLQRFANSGFLTAFSNAKERIGFNKNPLSFLFTKKVEHKIGHGHEIDRNFSLVSDFVMGTPERPRLYPGSLDQERVKELKEVGPYITISPASVWFTKQLPVEKWVELIQAFPKDLSIYMLGGPGDKLLVDTIINSIDESKIRIKNLAGTLRFLESAALMKDAVLNYVNDSAPLHICSAMNAPVVSVFCSTHPDFGFTPLSDQSFIIQTRESLTCRPCSLHGKKNCPEGHFKCGREIKIDQLLEPLQLLLK